MKRKMLTKITSLVITTAMVMSCSGFVFADETEESEVTEPAAETEVIEEPEVIDESEGSDEPEVIDEQEDIEDAVSVEEADPVDETEVIDEEAAIEEADAIDETEVDAESEDDYFEDITVEETIVVDSDYDNDYLAEQFILDSIDPSFQPSLRSYDYISQLTEDDANIVNALYPQISAIANGQRMSTEIAIDNISYSFTASDLGLANLTDSSAVKRAVAEHLPIDLDAVLMTLLSSCPYELYWFDKTMGISFSYSMSRTSRRVTVSDFTFGFKVANDYQDKTAQDPMYSMNTDFGNAINAAAANVSSIINTYAALDDYNKLLAYKTWICDHVTYNHDAANPNIETLYGNPWQLIWVFDGDDSTNVVCEGYSKAFQYLCDESTFVSDDIYAVSVYGVMGGNHMWNIVHMDDGLNYLVDVTNCDSGHDLFLVGATGSAATGYVDVNHGYSYVYDNDMLVSYPEADLTLSSTSYVPAPEGIALNDTNFPDYYFRSYISSNFDYDHNGYLSDEEISCIESIDFLSGEGQTLCPNIRDFTGIEYFTSLRSLLLFRVQLTDLDLSGMTSLESLNLMNSESLNSLDLSGCTSLTNLQLHLPNNFTSLNLSGCTSMRSLGNLMGYIRFESLDISGCTAITELDLNMQNLTYLDISGCTALTTLICDGEIQLTTLDLSGSPSLTDVYIMDGGVSSLSNLDLSDCPSLSRLYLHITYLDSFDISGCESLSNATFIFNMAGFNTINISESPCLIDAYENGVKTEYSGMNSYSNGDNCLSIPSSFRIITGTEISVTGVTLNTDTLSLALGGEAATLTATVLPADATNQNVSWSSSSETVATVSDAGVVTPVAEGTATITVATEDGGFTASCSVEVADLGVAINATNFPDDAFRSFVNQYDTNHNGYLSDEEISAVESIAINNSSINNLTGIKFFTALSQLYCLPGSNVLEIDLSGCESLTYVSYTNLGYSQATIDLSGCTSLSGLQTNGTGVAVSSLDLSGCTSLTMLESSRLSGLEYLDVSGCTALTNLDMDGNSGLMYVDLSGCSSLSQLHCESVGRISINLIGCPYLINAVETGHVWRSTSRVEYQGDPGHIFIDPLAQLLIDSVPVVAVTGVTLDQSSLNLTVGNTAILTAGVLPANATNRCVRWSSRNTAVATVSDTGVVTPVATGTTTITVTTQDGDYTASCTVIVAAQTVYPTGVTLDQSTINLFEGGETAILTATVAPSDTTYPNVTWVSNNERVATVSDNGVITTHEYGEATITAYTYGNVYSASCRVYVHSSDAIRIDSVNFPDEGFRNYVMNQLDSYYQHESDGFLDPEEIRSITSIDVSRSYFIQSLVGIEHFTALQTLDCSDCRLSGLDLSDCTALTSLDCSHNELTSLNLSGCTALETIDCSNNNLSGIRVRACTNLTELDCSSNSLTYLNVSNLAHLVRLTATDNSLSSINISSCSSLEHLFVHNNQLTALNLDDCPNLVDLFCSNNKIDDLDLSELQSLKYLLCANNQLESLDVSACPDLTDLYCDHNQFTSLDISNNDNLISLVENGSRTESAGVVAYLSSDYHRLLVDSSVEVDTGIVPTVAVTGVTVSPTELNLTVGASSNLTANVLPTNATNRNVTWSSNHTNIATVSNTGRVTAVAAGTATITVTTADGGYRATCAVTVTNPTVPVTGVTVSPTTLNLTVGGTSTLTDNVLPTNATNRNVTWSSNHTNIATVSNTGRVTAVAAGNAVITVTTADGGYTATCEVTVVNPTVAVTSVTVSPTALNLTVGDTSNLTANVLPTNATNRNVTWSSNHSNIARVSNTGVVTAVAAGTAVITVTTVDGGYTATCTVTVTEPVTTVDMYRLYNTNSGEHFYTSNAAERDMLIDVGWSYEGVGWRAPSRSNTPVYRLYNENGGEHHYTTNVAERDFLTSIGWNYEGIGWYSDDARTVPLYRQYNPNAFANNHNYTISYSENEWLVSIGWQAEGVGWYGVG